MPEGEVAAAGVDVRTNTEVTVAELLEEVEADLRGPNERHLKQKFSAFLDKLTDKQVHEIVTRGLLTM